MKTRFSFRVLMAALMMVMSAIQANAGYTSESHTITVGETVTLTVPGVIQQYSTTTLFTIGYTDCIRRVSASRYSITVKAVKATTTEVRITCNYQLTTGETGEHVFRVTVTGGSSGGSSLGTKDHVTVPESIKLNVGESKSVTAYTDAGMSVMWSWYGEDEEIVSMQLSGNYYQTATFTGLAAGETSVYAKSNLGGSSLMQIKVVDPVPAETLVLANSSLGLSVGEEHTLVYTVTPADATDADLTWSTSEKSVAAVDANGTVKALAAGTALITAVTESGLRAECTVVVTDIPELVIDDNAGLSDIPPVADVSYSRQLYRGWNSFCLPFTVTSGDLPDGCRMAAFQGLDTENGDTVLSFTDIQQADAGVPFLIYAASDTFFHYTGSGVRLVSSPLDGGAARGCFTRTVIGAGSYKLNAAGNAFGITRNASAVCAPFRIYIPGAGK